MRKMLFAAAFAAAMQSAPGAVAQTYPSRPITMVVPLGVGGSTDVIGRIMAEGMRASLGQPVIVENTTGAGGTIGVGRVARAAPDGYTIGIGQWGTNVASGAIYPLQFDLVKDFEPGPIGAHDEEPFLIVAKKSMPANNLGELITWLKANSDKASQGNSGIGTPSHVGGILFQNAIGAHFTMVPYRGAGQSMQDLVAGQIDVMLDMYCAFLPQLRGGTISAYAVTAKTRPALAPEIPTTDEAGLPGFYFSFWHAFGAARHPEGDRRHAQQGRRANLWPIRRYARSSSIFPRISSRATSRRRRRSAPSTRPKSRSGGRSSSKQASRSNNRSAILRGTP